MTALTPNVAVGIVEDQRETREGLAVLLDGTPGFRTAGAWRTMEEALAAMTLATPDIALVDIGLPGMSGIEGVRRLKAGWPQLPVVMLTVYGDNDSVFEAICAGASGYLLKDTPPDRLITAIREALSGGVPLSADIARRIVQMFQRFAPERAEATLTPRETDVLRLFSDGHSYKTAAHALGMSLDTLRFHVRHIYEKLHVNSKSEAVLKAFRSGLLR
jgi:DNA-binding NarL/FixJ family response regulator